MKKFYKMYIAPLIFLSLCIGGYFYEFTHNIFIAYCVMMLIIGICVFICLINDKDPEIDDNDGSTYKTIISWSMIMFSIGTGWWFCFICLGLCKMALFLHREDKKKAAIKES